MYGFYTVAFDPFSPSSFGPSLTARPWLGLPIWAWPVGLCSALFISLWLILGWVNRGKTSFYFDPQDYAFYEAGNIGDTKLPIAAINGESTFQPRLDSYIGVTKLAITLAAGSIVFAGNNSARVGIAAAKIFLAFAVVYGVLFCALMLYCYDEYGYDVHSYTAPWYKTVEASGFACFICFFLGYVVWAFNLT